MNIKDAGLLEELCFSSVKAGVRRLTQAGAWPRPPRARRLRAGHDFYEDELRNLPEVIRLVEQLSVDEDIRSLYPFVRYEGASDPDTWRLYGFWEVFFLRLLSQVDGPEPARAVYRRMFRRFLRELYSETVVWRTIDTVARVALPDGAVKLDQFTALAPITYSAWEKLTLNQDPEMQEDYFGLRSDDVAIITTMSIHKRAMAGSKPGESDTQTIKRAVAALAALRLCKPGVPRLVGHAQFQVSHFPIYRPLVFARHDAMIGLYEADTVLRRGDHRELRAVWSEEVAFGSPRQPAATKSQASLETAYARFLSSYDFQAWLDSIVDLTIALESLFNPTDSEELKHRIALRAAWLLSRHIGGTGTAENLVYRQVRAMYDMRSHRVHGGVAEESDKRRWIQALTGKSYDWQREWEQIEDAVEAARQIVRDAIQACRRLSKLPAEGPTWPFPPGFDENLVVIGQRAIWQKAAGIVGRKASTSAAEGL